MPPIELSFCVVNTSQRALLLRGLDAIARERERLPFASEVLVLDNGSRDGSARAAREHPAVDEVVALSWRRGKAENDSELLRRARRAYALLLNADFFVYSDEVDFARRLRDAGWRSIHVPRAAAIHHEQLATSTVPERRIVEMARNRDKYMRKHHSRAASFAVRALTAWAYALRA